MGKFKQILDNSNIGNKLIVLFSLTSAYVLFFCIYAVTAYGDLDNQIEDFTGRQSKGIYLLHSMADELYGLTVQNHAIIESNADVVSVQRHQNNFGRFYETKVKDYENSVSTAAQLELLDKFKNQFTVYQNVNRDIIRLLIDGHNQTAYELLSVKETSAFEAMRETLTLMFENHKADLLKGDSIIEKNISSLKKALRIAAIPMILLVIFSAFFVLRFLKSSFKNVTVYLSSLSKGIIPDKPLDQNNTELGVIGKYINITALGLKNLTRFSNEIANGNYECKTDMEAIEGTLAASLINLRDRLSATQEDQNLRHIEDEQRNWTTQGLAKFGDILRHSADNITALSDEVIKNLVHYINAGQGGLFILDDSDDQHPYLDMLSAFAYDRKKFLMRKISVGDGLVGMCALEKHTIFITHVPDDYIEMESGLGDSKPGCLLIVPLKSEDKILGVIELASFNVLRDFEINFVEKLGESIASTLSTLRINARTAELLQESQKKSDELAVRETELRKAMDEMTIAGEESQRREAEMSGILSAVDETLLKAEIDPEGKFISANQKFLSALGYRKEELMGHSIKNIMPDEYLENFDIIWQNIIGGQSYQTTVNQKNKFGENIWLLTQYTPIFDARNAVIRVLFMANDITEQKSVEEKNRKLLSESLEKAEVLMATQEKMAKNEIEMTGIITAIDETMMKAEYTVEGSLISANAKHISTMGYDYETTRGKNILTFIPEEEIAEFNALWQNVCEGNLYQMTVKRKSKLTGKDIWLINQYTPVKGSDGRVLKVLYTAFDITKHKEIEEQAKKQVEMLRSQNEAIFSQLETYKTKETNLKVRLTEYEKLSSDEISDNADDDYQKYRDWLKSFNEDIKK